MHQKTGLAYWAQRVVEELDNAAQNFDSEPVHDLRVALRRCRSLAGGFVAVDPDPRWKQMKKLGKVLFAALGSLRDLQVMEEWVVRFGDEGDPVRQDLLSSFALQEAQLKGNARVAAEAFDRKRWLALVQDLQQRTASIPLEGLVFQHIAVERWEEARELHRQALRNRSQTSFHRLRIGIKRLRYTVENFLPKRHAQWGADLKYLQDLLGEIHDLDVLGAVLKGRPSLAADDRERWEQKIREARAARLERYREKMLGRNSLWQAWRADLPQGPALRQAGLARLRTWASFLDPDVRHSHHVARLALQLYDGMTRDEVFQASEKQRRILETAALLHEVGNSRGNRAHHKQAYRLIRKITAPMGWTPEELRAVGAVARYHRGALPRPEHKCLRQLPASSRAAVIRLAGVLRLANAFDVSHDKAVRGLHIERNNGSVIVRGEGYSPTGALAERVAAARHLLESTCQVAILVRAS